MSRTDPAATDIFEAATSAELMISAVERIGATNRLYY
jgi:hypothetical protein